jgi:bacitracin synthase 1
MNSAMVHTDKLKLASLLLRKGEKELLEKKDIVEDPFLNITVDPSSKYMPFDLCSSQEVHLMGRSGFFDMTAGSNCYQSFVFQHADEKFIDQIDTAFQKLIARHDALRIKMINKKEQQVLQEVPQFLSLRKDFRNLEPAEIEARIQEEHSQLVFKRGDVHQWPLFDLVTLILPEDTVVLCWRMDLFIYDFPSRLVITNEFFKILKNPAIELPELHFSFRDYVIASNEAYKSTFFQKSKEYWQEKLPTFPQDLKLPVVHQIRPSTQTPKKAFLSKISAADWTKIKEIANRNSVTPSIVATASFAYVLRKFAKSPDFLMGLISFNRFDMHEQAEDVLGCFVQMIPFPFDFEAETFMDYCIRSREQLIEAMQNRYYPGNLVLRDLHQLRKAGAHSLCPVMLTLLFEHKSRIESFPDESQIGEVASEIAFQQLSLPQLQLHPGMGENPDGSFWCYWNHATGVFPEGLIKDMSECLTEILTELAAQEANWTVPFRDLCDSVVSKREISKYAELDLSGSDDEYVVFNPGNEELEEKLLGLIQTELGISLSSTSENLYDVGFNSLKIIQLLNLIREEQHDDLPQDILLGDDLTVASLISRLGNR